MLSRKDIEVTAMSRSQFSLETAWTPAADSRPLSYVLTLVNRSGKPVEGFQLRVSGPARIDPAATIEGGTLTARLSNHSGFSPPEGFVLEHGGSWRVTVHGLSYPLRHWSDGANTAYLQLADGSITPVAVAPTKAVGDNAPLRKGAEVFPVPASAPVAISVVPWPQTVAIKGSRAVPAGIDPKSDGKTGEEAAAAFAELSQALFPAEGIVRSAAEGGMPVRLTDDDSQPAEGYGIAFGEEEIAIRASSRTGFLYGLVTLGQILRGAKHHPETFLFPAGGGIEDYPEMGWRGSHLDVARQFYSSAEVTRFLRILAWNKMNRFHWHLSDDEAWRVEIDAYPELARIGAWRGHGMALPPLLGSGPEPWGGYYTKKAIREIVALGQRLGIEIVPEIDIPGHCYAVLQSLPQLRDPGETGEYFSVQGFPNNCLNPAYEPVYAFLEKVIDELAELFPFKTIHVGADEVPLAAWSGSPLALKKLAEIGGEAAADKHRKLFNTIGNLHGADEIGGSGTATLQAEFLRRIQAYIASRGCVTGGWEEAAHGDVIDKSKSYLVGWRNVEINAALAGQGYDIVVSPGQRYYLDMANSQAFSEPGAGWAGWSGPRETYDFDPVAGWSAAQKKHLLGVQACIWSEPMTDRAIFDRLVFPRLSAIAETGWTRKEAKSWDRFSALAGLMPILYGHWSAN
jgi:hexosaminidase